ncbi:MAG TPA: peptidoglycan bridge formation glycyltransferase FemA/FemB family protein, partial [Anaerolineae bacterium]|nr:peptidoglycan bridge formation glycyltransferase FemA/FemB family protein [Anaerolineae bacterium]
MITPPSIDQWDAFVNARGHILQSSAWAELKSHFGWSADRICVMRDDEIVAGASILFRSLPLHLGTLAYIPKGPIVDLDDHELTHELLGGFDRLMKQHRSILLKIEPDRSADESLRTRLADLSFQVSPQTIQPPRTITIDISRSEEEILAAMHQKTRYNIRLSAKKDVSVREAQESDLPAFNALMQATGNRDKFDVHSAEYYSAAYGLFVPDDRARLFVATYQEKIIAGIFVFALRDRAWYFYGASGDVERERMPNHALQWAAIRWAKSRGCTEYDLWGVPDENEATLEVQHLDRSDGLWGVYRFKRG